MRREPGAIGLSSKYLWRSALRRAEVRPVVRSPADSAVVASLNRTIDVVPLVVSAGPRALGDEPAQHPREQHTGLGSPSVAARTPVRTHVQQLGRSESLFSTEPFRSQTTMSTTGEAAQVEMTIMAGLNARARRSLLVAALVGLRGVRVCWVGQGGWVGPITRDLRVTGRGVQRSSVERRRWWALKLGSMSAPTLPRRLRVAAHSLARAPGLPVAAAAPSAEAARV